MQIYVFISPANCVCVCVYVCVGVGGGGRGGGGGGGRVGGYCFHVVHHPFHPSVHPSLCDFLLPAGVSNKSCLLTLFSLGKAYHLVLGLKH